MRQKQRVFSLFLLSPSSRRAWIEMYQRTECIVDHYVALLAEGVDRNTVDDDTSDTDIQVALLAEGVDRNISCRCFSASIAAVALLAEGVDRNRNKEQIQVSDLLVALLAEGVDRNVMRPSTLTLSRSRPPRGGRG